MNWRNYPGRHALAGYVALEHEDRRILALGGYEDAARRLVEGTLWSGEAVGGGREAHPVVVLPNGERVVVRRYRRGGMLRHLNRARYFAGNRAFDELRATERARAGGVRTVRVVAAAEHPRSVGYTALLATLHLPAATDAAAWLAAASGGARTAMLRDAGRQLAAMHAAGVGHPDVNLRNLLVVEGDAGPEVSVIDFDRARVYPAAVPEARRRAELHRLARSARKLGVGMDWGALREGYGAAWPGGLGLG